MFCAETIGKGGFQKMEEEEKTIFENIVLLIEFVNTLGSSKSPTHSHDNIKIVEGNKTWLEVKSSRTI